MAHRTAPVWERAVVRSTTRVADDVRHIVLDVPGNPRAATGAHVDVLVPGADGVRLGRSYSVVDDGRHAGAVAVAVRLDPRSRGGSAFMHTLRSGDAITVSHPVSDFELTPNHPRTVLLAGGIGITPMVGMARELRRRGADYRLFYAGRSRSTMAFLDQLRDDHGDRLEVAVEDEAGRFDVAVLLAGLAADTELYVCGPPLMLRAVQEAWQEAGRPPGLLRFETFGSGGSLPTLPFEIRVPALGIATTVPADCSALQALERAGGEFMADCLRGECGLCVVPVVAADGPIDPRGVFLSPRQKARDDQICLCVSRVAGGTLTVDPF